MHTDSFFLSMKTKEFIKDLKNLQDLFDFSILRNQELLSNKNKKVVDKFKKETPKYIWIDEVICLRSEAYSFKCGDDIKKIEKFF